MKRDKGENQAGPELNQRILVGNIAGAAAASARLDEKREYRNQFIPSEIAVASHADRPAIDNGFAGIKAINNDIQKTADDSAKKENENKYKSRHALIIAFEDLNKNIVYCYKHEVVAPIVADSPADLFVLSTHHKTEVPIAIFKGASTAQAVPFALHVAVATVPVPFEVTALKPDA